MQLHILDRQVGAYAILQVCGYKNKLISSEIISFAIYL